MPTYLTKFFFVDFATFPTPSVSYLTEFFKDSDAGLCWGRKFTNSYWKLDCVWISFCHLPHPPSMPLNRFLSTLGCKTWLSHAVYEQLLNARISTIVCDFELTAFPTPSVWYLTEFIEVSDAGYCWGRQFTDNYLKLASLWLSINSTLPLL